MGTFRTAALVLVVAGAIGGGGWYAYSGRTRELDGSCASMYGGANVCTWARVARGRVTELGAIVPVALAERAPANVAMEWPPRADAVIPLPEEAQRLTGFRHLTVFWEEHGHPPGPYLTPHFDFHFYTISPAEMDAIDCKDSSKPARLAAGYALPDVPIQGLGTLAGLCVPGMGMHSMPASELASGRPFEGTMIVGYYGRKLVFLEPMLSRSLLKAGRTFRLEVPALDAGDVKLPTRFIATYDPAARAYRFIFSGFPEV